MTTPAQPDPAAELRAAAQLLRQRAADARRTTPEPWTISHGPTDGGGVLYADNGWIVADRSCDEPDESIDLPYIALMHPGVGEAIVGVLESCARYADAYDVGPDETEDDPEFGSVITLARALLGGQP